MGNIAQKITNERDACGLLVQQRISIFFQGFCFLNPRSWQHFFRQQATQKDGRSPRNGAREDDYLRNYDMDVGFCLSGANINSLFCDRLSEENISLQDAHIIASALMHENNNVQHLE